MPVFGQSSLYYLIPVSSHNPDLRDSYEYIHKSEGKQVITRQSRRRKFYLVETGLTESCITVGFDSNHLTSLETICGHSYAAQICIVHCLQQIFLELETKNQVSHSSVKAG